MGPGPVDVLPLKVQLSVLPAFIIVHVSVSVGPVMPKLAVATIGPVMETNTDTDAPPYEPVMVLETVPPTVLVKAEKVALVAPANTVTLAGMVSGSLPDSDTTAPPAGAGPDNVVVPMTESPPTTLVLANVIEASATRAVTVSVGDWLLLPFIDAVIAAVPGATATMMKVALDPPAAIVTLAGTDATAELLLASDRLAPAAGAAVLSVTVPSPLPPAVTLVALSETADTAVGVGDVDEPPHCAVLKRAATVATSLTNGVVCLMMCLMRRGGINNGATGCWS